MATITITKHLYVGTKNIVSVHNPNILTWTFQPDDDQKIIASGVRYNNIDFNAVLTQVNTSAAPDIYHFQIDLTEILKYLNTTNYYHKQLPNKNSGNITYSLINKITLTLYGSENNVKLPLSSEVVFLSHGVNQSSNLNGSTMSDIYDRETKTFFFFPGYPGEIYWWPGIGNNNQDLLIDNQYIQKESFGGYGSTGLAGIALKNLVPFLTDQGKYNIDISQSVKPSLIIDWSNNGFSNFFAPSYNYVSFDDSGVEGHYCITNEFAYVKGKLIIELSIDAFTAYLPRLEIVGFKGYIDRENESFELTTGLNIIVLDTDWDVDTLAIFLFADDGQPLDVRITVVQCYNFTSTQTISIESLNTSCGGLYIRYLSRDGFYRNWLFNKYYTIEQDQKKIGSLVNNDYLTGMRNRHFNIGYKDAYRSYIATSENVRKDIRKQLMDLFTSPAVYLWNGKPGDTDSEASWTLVDIEGSHQLVEKQEFANFMVTIRLPELYTQML